MAASDPTGRPHRALPLGRPIPDSPHAVSVSMPTWADVVAYEEGDPKVLAALTSGYPRFVFHPHVIAAIADAEERLAQPGERALVFPSETTARRCLAFLTRHGSRGRWAAAGPLTAVLYPENDRALAKQFWQHTGEIVSSRRAEAALSGLTDHPDAARLKDSLRRHLAAVVGTSPRDVFLFPSGMASLSQALRLVQRLHAGRPTAQFGFPYVDSLKLQERVGSGALFYPIADEDELRTLETRLAAGDLGGVFCELPSNPLMQSVDLSRLAKATRAAGVPLVVDDSLATFYNHDFRPYADLLVSSLTKSFSGNGEAMGGTLMLNPASPLYDRLQSALEADYEDLLFGADAAVIAAGAADFETRMAVINTTAETLADALRTHPAVARVYYPKYDTPDRYRLALRPQGGYGGMFSLVLVDPERHAPAFYDRLQVDKGPSFGLRTTLVCPYTLLAHFTELDWAERCHVSRHLIRVSVGLEDAADLIARFIAALDSLTR